MECLLHHSDPFNKLQCIVRGKHHILAPPKQRISGEVVCVIECSCKPLGRWNGCVLSICVMCSGGAFVWKYCTEHCSMVEYKPSVSGRTGFGPKKQIHRCRPGPWVLQCPCETFVATNALSGRQVLTHNLGILLPHC